MEKGNLKLAESIFNSLEVSNDSNHSNKCSKSYKMAVSFKLNNAEFPPLPFPSTSKPVWSTSTSLHLLLLANLFFAVLLIGHLPLLACNIPIKHNQQSARKSVQSVQPVVVNINVVLEPVRHRLHVVKSVFHHQRVFCLAKPIFLTVDTVTDTPDVKYVTSTHNVCKVFPSTQNSISIPTQICCPNNNENNIASSHLPLTKPLPSSETKSSNLCSSECTFSLPKISCP